MNGGIAQLAGAFICTIKFCYDAYIFGFSIIGIHAAKRCDFQAAVFFDGCNHTAERIGMCFQKEAIILIFSAQTDKDSSFVGQFGFISEFFKFSHYKGSSFIGIACRRINCQKFYDFIHNIIRIFFYRFYSHGSFFLSDFFTV